MHKFIAEQLKIYKVSADEPLSKVIDFWKPSNFSFGRFSSSLENIGEKHNQSSVEFKPLTKIQSSEFFPQYSELDNSKSTANWTKL